MTSKALVAQVPGEQRIDIVPDQAFEERRHPDQIVRALPQPNGVMQANWSRARTRRGGEPQKIGTQSVQHPISYFSIRDSDLS